MTTLLALLRKWIKEAGRNEVREAFVNLDSRCLLVQLNLTERQAGSLGTKFGVQVMFDWLELDLGMIPEEEVQMRLAALFRALEKERQKNGGAP